MTKHSLATGLDLHEDKRIKQPARAVATANVTLTAPGSAMDGVTLVSGDRVLLTGQTAPAENGLYTWTGAATTLGRVSDASSSTDFTFGFKVYVREGSVNGTTYWTYTQATSPVVLGTTALTFVKDGATGVTSVALTMPSEFSVSGSPITSSGTLSVTAATQTANTVKAGPTTGAAAAPTYRALVTADLPSAITITGENTASDFRASGLTGSVAASRYVGATATGAPTTGAHSVGDYVIAQDGFIWICTSAGTPGTFVSDGFHNPMTTTGDLIVGGSSGAPTRLAASSTSGQVLTSNGAGVSPTYQTPSGGGGGGGSAGTGGSIVPIQTQTPTGTGTVTFNVPAGFRNVRFTASVRSDTAATLAELRMQFNGDTGSDYNTQNRFTSATTVSASQSSGAGSTVNATSAIVGQVNAASSASTVPANIIIDIPNHASPTFAKQFLSRVSSTVAGNAITNTELEEHYGNWNFQTAISSITLFLSAGNFVSGSTITLWGEADTAPVLMTTNSNLIQETILSASTASILILNIPQGYKDIRVVLQARADNAVHEIGLLVQANGDTGSNYDWTRFESYSSTTAAFGSASDTSLQLVRIPAASNTTTSAFGAVQLTFANFTNTSTNKSIIATGSCPSATAGDMITNLGQGEWRSTSAITSLTLSVASSGNFVAGTVVRVYGEPASAAGPSVGTGTRLRIGTNQSLTSGSALAVPWDTEDTDADNQHYTSAANLTGTVAKTAGSATLTGTTTVFLTELSVGQVISVPGTAAEVAVVIAIASNTSLTVAAPFANTASGQTATRVNSAIVFRQPGFFDVEVGAYLDAVSTGVVTLQVRLNGTTIIGQNDRNSVNAVAAYDLVVKRQFLQWDYIEVLVTQNSGGALNLRTDERTHVAVSARPVMMVVPGSQTSTAQALSSGDTIPTANLNEARVAPSSAVTGVILQPGTYGGQEVWVVNETGSVNTVTFASSGTSNVSGGTNAVIPGLQGYKFVWDTGTSRWYTTLGGGSGSTTTNVLAGATAGSIVPIQTQTLTATAASVTFSVPAGFKNAFVTLQAQSDTAATGTILQLQFNGDTGSNYDNLLTQNNTGFTSLNETIAGAQISAGEIAGATAPAGTPGDLRVFIENYAGTTFHKSVRTVGGVKLANSTGNIRLMDSIGFWRSTAPITSLLLKPAAGNFVVGSTFTLWGEADTAPALLTTNSNLIQETILTVAAASISISNIPQGYRDLRIMLDARSDTAATNTAITAQVNGDTGTNYNWESLIGTNIAAGGEGLSQTSWTLGLATAASATASRPGVLNVVLPAYADTTFHKTFFCLNHLSFNDSSTNTQSRNYSGTWRSAAAITSLTLTPAAGNFVAGTVARVYGEPAAAAGASVGTGTRLRISSNQSITTATATAITWDTEDNDADNQHYTSAANITGTVTKTAASATVTGSGTAFLTELSVGQVIAIPGTATEKRVVIAIASNTSLTTNSAFVNSASSQPATRINSVVVFRQPGFYSLEANVYSAALSTGAVTLAYYLNSLTTATSGTAIAQLDPTAINASAGYPLNATRQFQQWDFVEVIWTQNSGGAVNVLADERTHFSISARPTVIAAVPYVHIVDRKTAGTDGGTFTNAADRTRDLNTIMSDTAGIASLSSNQITLQAGTYRCAIQCPCDAVNQHRAWLFNVTDSVEVLGGTNGLATNLDWSYIKGKFVLTGTKVLEVRHRCRTTASTNGFGAAVNSFFTVPFEVYTTAEFWKEG
jgi:hypothetical protein